MDTSQNRIGSAAQKMKEGATELGSAFMDKSGDLKDAALEKGRVLKEAAVQKGRAVYDQSSKTITDLQAQGESHIKSNPYSSVLYALGVGALIGGISVFLMSGKSEEEE